MSKFKVGDVVERINCNISAYTDKGAITIPIGAIGTVERLCNCLAVDVNFDGVTCKYSYESNLRLVDDFKVGDIVEYTGAPVCAHQLLGTGDVCTITWASPNNLIFDVGKDGSVYNYISKRDLRLIKRAEMNSDKDNPMVIVNTLITKKFNYGYDGNLLVFKKVYIPGDDRYRGINVYMHTNLDKRNIDTLILQLNRLKDVLNDESVEL